MKAMALVLLGLLLVLAGVAAAKGDGTFMAGLRSSGSMLIRFLPILIVAVAIAGFTEALIPKQFVETWLSDASGWKGMAVGWLAGVLTPAGSIVGLPLVGAMWKAGVGVGVLMTYMTSMALLSVIRMPIEIGIIGWRLTAMRVLVSLVLPILAGLTARALGGWLVPPPAGA